MIEITSIAPGRTCLFGDHQDYLGLPIIACAINRHVTLKAIINGSDRFVLDMPDIGVQRTLVLSENISAVEKGDHLLSALKVVKRHGCIPDKGYDVRITSDVPINAGLSSSSALVVSWINFLLAAYSDQDAISPNYVAQLAYEAEVVEHGSPGGKMDQYSSALGNVLYLETGDELAYEVIKTPIKGMIIGESGIPKETIGVLGHQKENALLAISHVKAANPGFELAKATEQDLTQNVQYVPDHLKDYFVAAIKNHLITKNALAELKQAKPDFQIIGRLMNEHHAVLRDLLHITVPRIDAMIEATLAAGAYGTKIVGSGMGGSIVAIAPEGREETIIAAMLAAGAKAAYKVEVDSGAQVLINK